MKSIEQWLSGVARFGRISDVIFRVLFSWIFIVGGLGHFFQLQQMLARIDESPWADVVRMIGNPSVLLWLSGAVFVICGISLALGYLTRLSALALFVTLVPITISVHLAPGHVGPLLKNIAILGGLIHFFVRGAGSYSIDNRQIQLIDRYELDAAAG
jgi:putative oxidoreductase